MFLSFSYIIAFSGSIKTGQQCCWVHKTIILHGLHTVVCELTDLDVKLCVLPEAAPSIMMYLLLREQRADTITQIRLVTPHMPLSATHHILDNVQPST